MRSTAEIQALKIIACEKDRGATRLRFICGQRLLQHLTGSMTRDRELNVLLNCGPDAFASNVERLQKERKDMVKDYKSASEELAGYFGRSLASASTPPPSGTHIIYHHRPHTNLTFIAAAAEAALASRPDALVVLTGDELPPPPAAKKAGAAPPADDPRSPQKSGRRDRRSLRHLRKRCSHCRARNCRAAARYGGQGGGRAIRYQGQGTNVLAAAEVVKAL